MMLCRSRLYFLRLVVVFVLMWSVGFLTLVVWGVHGLCWVVGGRLVRVGLGKAGARAGRVLWGVVWGICGVQYSSRGCVCGLGYGYLEGIVKKGLGVIVCGCMGWVMWLYGGG